jgi:hypothetical protein
MLLWYRTGHRFLLYGRHSRYYGTAVCGTYYGTMALCMLANLSNHGASRHAFDSSAFLALSIRPRMLYFAANTNRACVALSEVTWPSISRRHCSFIGFGRQKTCIRGISHDSSNPCAVMSEWVRFRYEPTLPELVSSGGERGDS